MKHRPTLAALGVFVLLGVAMSPAPCRADVPNPPFSTFDPVLVGTASGTAVLRSGATIPGFRVVVRDMFNMPIAGATVDLEFQDAPTVRGQGTQNPGTTVNCALRTMRKVTDASGTAIFAARFGGFDNANHVLVMADGVVLGSVRARSTDMAGDDGATGLADLALFSRAYVPTPCASCPEADFDASGGPVGLNDFAILAREFLLNAPAGTYCW